MPTVSMLYPPGAELTVYAVLPYVFDFGPRVPPIPDLQSAGRTIVFPAEQEGEGDYRTYSAEMEWASYTHNESLPPLAPHESPTQPAGLLVYSRGKLAGCGMFSTDRTAPVRCQSMVPLSDWHDAPDVDALREAGHDLEVFDGMPAVLLRAQ